MANYRSSVNDNIRDFLQEYVKNPDPCYAVMLKGKWGCGKTHFIDKWLEDYQVPNENIGTEDIVLKPIKVTLYGMKKTDEITKAIDRELHPYLYTKYAQIGKNLLRIAGNVMLKTNFNVGNSGDSDISFSASLDSLSLFKSEDDSIKGVKFLIFDDLERCQVDMKLLLGYINFFVEHCGCHVVIVGDDTKVEGDDLKTLNDFKEKTVGREFEIAPDIDGAIDCFLEEVPRLDFLKTQRELIKTVFVATQTNNLRILRQCLYDFKVQYNALDSKLLNKDKSVLPALLASFIAVYSEYKGENKEIIQTWDTGSWGFLFSKEDSDEKKAVMDIERRYSIESLNGINVMNNEHVMKIVAHIERGIPLKQYIDRLMENDQVVKGVLQRLENFREMENGDFLHDCQELSNELLSDKYQQFYSIGKALAFFSLFEREQLFQVGEDVINHVKSLMQKLFDERVGDLEVLYKCRSAFWQALNMVDNSKGDLRIHKEMGDFFREAFEKREAELPDKMQETLNNLNNDNIQLLYDLNESTTPDGHTSYSLMPILKQQDAALLMKRVKGLTNANVRNFAIFLAHHFALDHSLGDGFSSRFKEDKDTLDAIKPLVVAEIGKNAAIRKWAFEYLLKVVNGCIKRAEGETEPLPYSM